MFVGYVSDENYVAIADAALEFERNGKSVAAVHSTARGAVFADLAPGDYRVTISKTGYTAKLVDLTLVEGQPYQFRLLSDQLLGYVWPKWVKSGENSEFRVHSPQAYRLSLWRYGLQKEFVRLIGWFDEHGPRAVTQILPDGDFVQSGVRWNSFGYGSVLHGQQVKAPERSGLYYFHAESENGDFFTFPWIVAPSMPQASIAVLASTNTWNAYNNFGGRSNYVNPVALPPTPTINARQQLGRYTRSGSYTVWREADEEYTPLSFDRPEPFNHIPRETELNDPIRGRQPCHIAPTEWRLLGWLEREGFAYDFYSEAQLHFDQLDLDAYKVLILSTHPEYWSRRMFDKVKEWVQKRGGRLLYLGGNGLNCEIEFLDPATMRCNTQLILDEDGLTNRDPADPSAGYESRMHRRGESEAALLGVVYTDPGAMTAAPYRVVQADHWIFAGTGLHNGDTFGEKSLHERIPGGASGHETDKRSASTPPGTVLLAKGTNQDEGGAEMVIYETASGGAVFSVGSITWPACILVDNAVSTITANVIRRFLR
ncbi:MAG: carboxypeptidase-like regulatory domain-containing protein [Caldilineaceae bacterium]